MPFTEHEFKEVLSRYASGVTVVTTCHESKPVGITVTSFTSVSLAPPLVLVCIANHLYTCQAITQSGVFAVNILASNQRDHGNLFAGRLAEQDRFANVGIHYAVTGSPLIAGAVAWLDCQVRHTYAGGDHTIFVGEVVAGDRTQEHAPLLYFNRRWGLFNPMPD